MRHQQFQSIVEGIETSRWPVVVDPRMDEWIDTERRPTSLRRAEPDELTHLLATAGQTLDLADRQKIDRMLRKNADIVQAVRTQVDGPPVGLFAYLPLNEFGAGLLVRGAFDGSQPDPAWIVPTGEKPAALYLWLFHGPMLFRRSFGAIGALFARVGGGDVPVFTRSVNEHSARATAKMGFLPAAGIYPEAPEWLLVALPENGHAVPEIASRAKVGIKVARSMEDMTQVLCIRAATYLAEQFCLYDEEFDGNDFCSTQLIGTIDGDPAGCLRLRYFGDFAKVERLAVRREYRNSRLAFKLVRAGLDHLRAKGFRTAYGHAREDLVPFWSMFGFRVMADRAPFSFANVAYREMVADLPPDEHAIRIGAPAMMIVRPEGRWDEPGPLDRSIVNADAARASLLKQHTRFVQA